jgi:hypothetical protein
MDGRGLENFSGGQLVERLKKDQAGAHEFRLRIDRIERVLRLGEQVVEPAPRR